MMSMCDGSLFSGLMNHLNLLAAPPTTSAGYWGWFNTLFTGDTVAHAVLVLSLVTALGLALGTLRVLGISLGIAGVLFVGIIFGHYNLTLNEHVIEFAREFGLILFVYTIGLQVGPGFLSSLRKAGLKLNLLAAALVMLGVITTLTIVKVTEGWGDKRIEIPEAVGLLTGGTTNTPSLGAAEQALRDVLANRAGEAETQGAVLGGAGATKETTPLAATATPGTELPAGVAVAVKKPEAIKRPGMGYAIAYPFGILGIIFTMILVRFVFRINIGKETEELSKSHTKGPVLHRINLEVTNPNLDFMPIGAVPVLNTPGIVVSRALQGGKPYVGAMDTILHLGDVLHIVGPVEKLEELKLVVGKESKIDVKKVPSQIVARRMVVTKSEAINHTIEELDLMDRFGVSITRVSRAEVEICALPDWRFQYGDQAYVVGSEAALKQVSEVLGDSMKKLDHPQIIPVFIGIALGVILGSWPVMIPGMSVPVKLGLAGGPLVVSLILARIGQIGKVSWYMPRSANFALRELGILLFLACVGLKAGHGFWDNLVNGQGLYWMLVAAIITAVPLLLVAFFSRLIMKLNYVTICGLLAGSMTDPPALAFANNMVGGEAPSVAYATVYPLTMILRIISAQAIVLLFFK